MKDGIQSSWVTCRVCGYQSANISIHCIQRCESFGCWCNTGVSWCTEEGWSRFLKIVEERGLNYNISEMAHDWWWKSIEGCDSKLVATCRICGHRSTNTCIHNIQQGHSFGCWCNGAGQWNTEEGWLCLKKLVEERGLNYDISEMTLDWWVEFIKGSDSKLVATCRVCGHHSTNTDITSIQQGNSSGCWCTGTCQWNTEEGWHRFQKLVEERGLNYDISEMTLDWWLEFIKGANSKLLATCCIWGHRSTNTCISHIQQGQSFGCGCRNKTEAAFGTWFGRVARSHGAMILAQCIINLAGKGK